MQGGPYEENQQEGGLGFGGVSTHYCATVGPKEVVIGNNGEADDRNQTEEREDKG